MKGNKINMLIAVVTLTAIILGIYHILGIYWSKSFQQIYVNIAQYFLIIYLLIYISKKFIPFAAYFLIKLIYVICRALEIEPFQNPKIKFVIWITICLTMLIISLYLLYDKNDKGKNNMELSN